MSVTRSPGSDLEILWRRGLAVADPFAPTLDALPQLGAGGRVSVLAVGKGAARMAEAAEAAFGAAVNGLAVTPYGYGAPLKFIEMIEAAHPVPDATGQAAAERALALAAELGADDHLIVLLSGGASALWPSPAAGVSLADKQALSRALLASGAPIQAINTVRRHLSRIKGGRLAAAAFPCPVLTLAVSDVPGDEPSAIGSGPTVADPTTLEDARSLLARFGVTPSPEIAAALDDPANESPKPGDPRLAGSDWRVILTPRQMIEAVAAEAGRLGYEPVQLGDDLQGEARDVAVAHAALALDAVRTGRRAAFVSGGELDVTGAAGGSGGRCREYLLALAVALGGEAGVYACALDTDGIDGAGGQAGAVVTPNSLVRAKRLGLDPNVMLNRHMSGDVFASLGDDLVTGPTRTNLSDLRIVLTAPDRGT